MTTTNQREWASDASADPLVYYVYILRLQGGEFYIGQTNDLSSRLVEHRLDAGAKATRGQDFQLVWFNHVHSREAAKQMEARLQRALKRSPLEIQGVVDRFQNQLDMVRPQKSLKQLQAEDSAYESEMRKSFHWVPIGPFANPQSTAKCGYAPNSIEGGLYGTSDPGALLQMERERVAVESVGGTWHERMPCQDCLVLIPSEQ